MTAAGVVDAYTRRAPFCRAETAAVRRPRCLPGLLTSARHVAEIPCGTGHFLADYARTGCAVTLVDANSAMLTAAVEHAAAAGLSGDQIHPIRGYLCELAPLIEVDLVVVLNAALNQLACQSSLGEVLAAVRHALQPGVPVLAQVACVHRGGRVDRSGFYDASRQHRVWFVDRRFDPARAGGAAVRRRRQQRDGDLLRVEFAYDDPKGNQLHRTSVDLAVFTPAQLADAFTRVGFRHVRFLAGRDGLSEVLAEAGRRG